MPGNLCTCFSIFSVCLYSLLFSPSTRPSLCHFSFNLIIFPLLPPPRSPPHAVRHQHRGQRLQLRQRVLRDPRDPDVQRRPRGERHCGRRTADDRPRVREHQPQRGCGFESDGRALECTAEIKNRGRSRDAAGLGDAVMRVDCCFLIRDLRFGVG